MGKGLKEGGGIIGKCPRSQGRGGKKKANLAVLLWAKVEVETTSAKGTALDRNAEKAV